MVSLVVTHRAPASSSRPAAAYRMMWDRRTLIRPPLRIQPSGDENEYHQYDTGGIEYFIGSTRNLSYKRHF